MRARPSNARPETAGRTALLGVAILVGAWASACASPPKPQARAVELAPLEEALGQTRDVAALRASLPASFLVGSARELDALLAERSRLAAAHPSSAFATVVDLSGIDELAATAARDRTLEAALDGGGEILLDASGACARSLRGGSPARMLVRIERDGSLGASARLPGASAPEETAALGG